MLPAEVVAERFELERRAGSGGMAIVYRARDRVTGGVVALKVLREEMDPRRFDREIRLLADLDHPAIVRHVAHGAMPDGRPFHAMEWLEGETLAERLARGRLPLADVPILFSRIAG